jgi:hypothetical protein
MAITLNGTTGITTPANTSTGNDTVAGTLQVGGITTNVYPLVSGTSVASTSGTSIDFTSIPSWVKRVTVMFNGVSTSGTSNHQIQLGAGSVTSSGYTSTGIALVNAVANSSAGSTAGFILGDIASASAVIIGHMTITNVSGNIWIASGNGRYAGNSCFTNGGSISLSGTLDRVRITTVNGTDTFDAGSINILYE